MYYDRKVKYLDYFERGERIKGAGFVKMEARDRTLRMELSVTGLHETDSFERDVVLCAEGREEGAGKIRIAGGKGQWRWQWQNLENIGGLGISYEMLTGVSVHLGAGREISCRWENSSSKTAPKGKVVLQAGKDRRDGRMAVPAGKKELQAAEMREFETENGRRSMAAEKQGNRREKGWGFPNRDEPQRNGEGRTVEREEVIWEGRGEAGERKEESQERKGRNAERKESIWGRGREIVGREEGPREGEKRTVEREESSWKGRGEAVGREEGPREGEKRTVEREESSWKGRGENGEREQRRRIGGAVITEKWEGGRRRASMEEQVWGEPGNREGETHENSRREIGFRKGGMNTTEHLTEKGKVVSRNYGGRKETGRGHGEAGSEKLMEEKWEQLWAIYPHIRPFQDEREYISIRPVDFVIFPEESYKMANNSFLLHGYYNYHHLLLTKVERRGEPCYYIGVPGNFFEKEKQVAIMFGFESFECAEEPAQAGDFGYYMMRTLL